MMKLSIISVAPCSMSLCCCSLKNCMTASWWTKFYFFINLSKTVDWHLLHYQSWWDQRLPTTPFQLGDLEHQGRFHPHILRPNLAVNIFVELIYQVWIKNLKSSEKKFSYANGICLNFSPSRGVDPPGYLRVPVDLVEAECDCWWYFRLSSIHW